MVLTLLDSEVGEEGRADTGGEAEGQAGWQAGWHTHRTFKTQSGSKRRQNRRENGMQNRWEEQKPGNKTVDLGPDTSAGAVSVTGVDTSTEGQALSMG